MRKIWLVLSIMLVVMALPAWADEVEITETDFPDANFRTALLNKYDTNTDGKITDTELSSGSDYLINVNGSNITSMKGIELFTNLYRLQCANNNLLSLNLGSLSRVTPVSNALGSLTSGRQTRTLEGKIIVSEGEEYPYSINLKSEDQYFDITKVTVNSFTDYYSNTPSVSEYTLVDTALGLIKFKIKPTSLTYLYDTGALANKEMCVTVTFTGDARPPEVAITAANFPDSVFLAYISSDLDINHDGVLDEYEVTRTDGGTDRTVLDVHGKGISSLEGIKYFTEITSLNCTDNNLTALDVSANTKLTTVICSSNDLDTLDVSANTELTYLDCSANALTSLNVSSNTELTYIKCSSNKLAALDVSHNTKLETLNCYGNVLEALDVSNNTALATLNCGNNCLMALELAGNSSLTPQPGELDTQTVSFRGTHTDKARYPYRINLNDYASRIGTASDFLNRVAINGVKGFNHDYRSGNTVYFSSRPSFTYTYDTHVPNVQNKRIEGIKASFTFTEDPATVSFSQSSISVQAGNSVNISLSVSSNVGAVTWSLMSNPLNLSINASTGAITGTVPASTASGRYTTTARSSTGLTASTTIIVTAQVLPKTDTRDILNPNPHKFTMSAALRSKISSKFGRATVSQLSDSEVTYGVELTDNDLSDLVAVGESAAYRLPSMKPSSGGVYVLKYNMSTLTGGQSLNLRGITGHITSSALGTFNYAFFDENGNDINAVPSGSDKTVYVALVLESGTEKRGAVTVSYRNNGGVLQPVDPADYNELIKNISNAMGIDPSRIKFFTDENITPDTTLQLKGESFEFRPAETVSRESFDVVGSLGIIHDIKEPGYYYTLKVSLNDDMFNKLNGESMDIVSVITEEYNANASVKSSILLYGVLNTIELLTLKGEKISDIKFGFREFLMIGLLGGSTPFTIFLAKLIPGLGSLVAAVFGGGCNVAFGAGISALAVVLFLRRIRH